MVIRNKMIESDFELTEHMSVLALVVSCGVSIDLNVGSLV